MFRVALALGKHLHEVEALPVSELDQWAAYEPYDPFGAQRFDLLAATVAMVVANKFSKRRFWPKDFMPRWKGARRRQQSPEQMRGQMAVLLPLVERK